MAGEALYHPAALLPYERSGGPLQYCGGNCAATCMYGLAIDAGLTEVGAPFVLLPPTLLPPVLLRYGDAGPQSSNFLYSSMGLSISDTENGVVCEFCCLGLKDMARSTPLSSGSMSGES